MNCPVCEAPQESVYTSGSQASVTSICSVLSTTLEVRMCTNCSLVQTMHSPSLSLSGFWGEYHRVQSQATEPVLRKEADRVVLRAEYEAGLMQETMGLLPGSRLMILGGVRAETARVLRNSRPDLEIYSVLESPAYQERLGAFLPADHLAVSEIPAVWLGTFDAVASLYDLAHESDPLPHLEAMVDLLKPDGRLLICVPNLLTNRGDLVVANHLIHFTFDSLRHLLQTAGLAEVRVDGNCFEGRLVATAVKAVASRHNLDAVAASTFEAIRRIGHYWSEFGERVRAFESAQGDKQAAIYGAGFYGAFILSQLQSPDRIDSFFDGNTGLSGKTIASIPVCVPSKDGVNAPVLYMGLNPEIAAKVGGNLGREGQPTFFP